MRAGLWDRMYRGTPSWELGAPDPALLAALERFGVPHEGRAIDLGCGTGDNAIALARWGLEVTGIDLATRPLAQARDKADAAGVVVDLQRGDVTRPEELAPLGRFDLIVDRGLLMSLFGERARRRYVATVTAIAADGARCYQHQWELPAPPRPPSRAWLAARAKGLVLAPGELERRLGEAFTVERLRRDVGPADDPGMRRLGIREVARVSSWLTRRTGTQR